MALLALLCSEQAREEKKKKIQDHIECPFLAVEHILHYHTQMAMELQCQVSIASMWEEGNRSQSSQSLCLWCLESSVDFYIVDWFESWKEILWSHQYALGLRWRLMCSRPSHWWTCLSGCTGLGWTYLMSKTGFSWDHHPSQMLSLCDLHLRCQKDVDCLPMVIFDSY